MSTTNDNSWDKILVGSPSYNIYKEFDSEVKEEIYNKYCIEFNNQQDEISRQGCSLCKKIARNVDKLSNYLKNIEYTPQCSHYKYWAYHNIKKILGDNIENEKAKPLINKLLQAQNSMNKDYYLYYCQYSFGDNISQRLNDKINEKHLHDYFKNYDSIKKSDTCKNVKPEEYEKYLNYINNLYNKYRSEKECCDGSWQYECFDYFNCSDEFDPSKLLSSLTSKGNKDCDNLKIFEKPLTFFNSDNSESSQIDIKNSIYHVKCTDIPTDRLDNNKLIGGTIRCHVLPSFPASLNNRSSSFTHRPPEHAPFTIDGHIVTPVTTELQRDNQVSSGSSKQQNHSSNLHASGVIKDKSAEKDTPCENPQLARDESGACIEPDVRKTNTIGVKLNVFAPGKTIIIRLNPNSYMYKNNFFRFTPFGRCFHKKVPRKKRIDDYYDDPYMRQFIIRAPKSGKRRTGNRGLQFSYYSR
ncbi:PIR Superfamily Protein [Plasmodium malariae]|uniref:PIR Superfamily Protein n=1 Tax=Plasmodium malariae TaxID=5858 RepID=A0A1A8X4F8_PLAMA|nr:PIR Superfamily Protein [Plasmodium malariae]